MKLSIMIVAVAGSLAVPAAASAAPSAPGGCATSRTLLSIDGTLARIDRRIYTDEEWAGVITLIEGVDTNGDGWLCSKQFAPNRGQDKQWGAVDYVITQIGDNVPQGHS